MSIPDNAAASARTSVGRRAAASLGGPDWLDVEIPCRNDDVELWFSQSVEHLARAQLLCQGCPLRIECLAGATQRSEPWGVWGGQLFEHGVPGAHRRRRGRPRKRDEV